MNVLRQANSNILGFLGSQYYKEDVKYRINKYCYTLEQEYYTIVYNTLTGGIVTLYPVEMDNIFVNWKSDYVDHLCQEYFLVPEDFDEDAIIESYRNKMSKEFLSNYLDNPDTFTILSTTKCNANCTYCYEHKIGDKHDMTIETAHKVADFIINNGERRKPISIGWFGGEPLSNTDVIDLISIRVRSAGFDFNTTMVSNGYLFNKDIIHKAKHLWGLSSVQITLDGTEEVYNKTKRYIYKDDPSPFRTVISNIHELIKNDIFVSIRLNCGSHNSKNLLDLVRFLAEEFKFVKHKFAIYVWEIFTNKARTEEEAEKLFPQMAEINGLIRACELNRTNTTEHGIKTIHCMVDAGNGVTIDPSGNLGVCEHYPDSDFIGHIDTPHVKNFDILKTWRNYIPTTEPICQNCPIRPICLKMDKCTDQFICTKAEQKYLLDKLNLELLDMDRSFNNRNEDQNTEQCSCRQCNQD